MSIWGMAIAGYLVMAILSAFLVDWVFGAYPTMGAGWSKGIKTFTIVFACLCWPVLWLMWGYEILKEKMGAGH